MFSISHSFRVFVSVWVWGGATPFDFPQFVSSRTFKFGIKKMWNGTMFTNVFRTMGNTVLFACNKIKQNINIRLRFLQVKQNIA